MTVTQKAPEANSAQKGGSKISKLPLLFLVLLVAAGLAGSFSADKMPV